MKKIIHNKLVLVASSLVIGLFLLSNSAGRGNVFGEAVTGAPGDSNRTCASSGCHSSGAFDPSADLNIADASGNTVTSFNPGETYDVTLSITAGNGTPSRYGFQMVALKEDGNGATEWSELGSNVRAVEINTNTYIEQLSSSTSNMFTAKWTAPESGSGDVTFYYAINAANGNGGFTGDGGINDNFVISEASTSTNNLNTIETTIYPNPTSNRLVLETNVSDFNYSIMSANGQIMMKNNGNNQTSIDVSSLNTGLYYIQISNNDSSTVQKFIKI